MIEPFSVKRPSILTGRLTQKISFALNLENPSGIKLLSKPARERLERYLLESSGVPRVLNEADSVDRTLVNAGLICLADRTDSNSLSEPKIVRRLSYWIHITNGCNSNCFYCYIPGLEKGVLEIPRNRPDLVMSKENIDMFIRRLSEHMKEHKVDEVHLKFAGGEPSLAVDEMEYFCTLAQSSLAPAKVSFGIITNAFTLQDRFLKLINNFDFAVSISIDGIRTAHDRIRFVRRNGVRLGTFDRIISNARKLINNGKSPYFLHTLTQKNHDELSELFDVVIDLKCGMRVSLERGERPISKELQECVLGSLTSTYEALPDRLPVNQGLQRYARFAEWNLNVQKRLACTTCRGYSAISTDGQVSSCQMRLDEPVGRLKDQSIGELTELFHTDPETSMLVNPSLKDGPCTKCEFKNTCAGGCPQHSKNVFGTVNSSSPWCYTYGSFFPVYVNAAARHFFLQYQMAARRKLEHNSSTVSTTA